MTMQRHTTFRQPRSPTTHLGQKESTPAGLHWPRSPLQRVEEVLDDGNELIRCLQPPMPGYPRCEATKELVNVLAGRWKQIWKHKRELINTCEQLRLLSLHRGGMLTDRDADNHPQYRNASFSGVHTPTRAEFGIPCSPLGVKLLVRVALAKEHAISTSYGVGRCEHAQEAEHVIVFVRRARVVELQMEMGPCQH